MAQEIATQTTMSLETHTSGPRLSEKLTALVAGNENPIVGPVSVAELRQFIAQPEQALPTQGQVDTMLAKLALATAAPKVSDAEARERLEIYWLALRDLPVEELRVAFLNLVRAATFLPTPAEVRAAAVAAGHPRRRAIVRAKHLIWLHERSWRPPATDLVDIEDVRALIAQTSAGIGEDEKIETEGQ